MTIARVRPLPSSLFLPGLIALLLLSLALRILHLAGLPGAG